MLSEQFGFNVPVVAIGLIILVQIEFVCAIGLWQNKMFTIYSSVGLLLMFNGIALFQYLSGAENCGCFGTVVSFTPVETLIKNCIMIVVLVIANKKRGIRWTKRKFISS